MKVALPLLVLVFLSPFFIELQSGNIPFPNFFMPGTFIFLLTVGYGFAAIVIRELSVRYNMGFLSVLLLGIAYGLYNEGIVARTLIRDYSMPVEAYNGAGLVLGLNIGFMLVITLAHALQAIVYPIFFTHRIFPGVRSTNWISRKMMVVLVGILFIFGTLTFFRTDEFGTGSGVAYLTLLVLMSLLVWLAILFRARYHLEVEGAWSKKTILLGATGVVPFLAVSVFAGGLGLIALTILFFTLTGLLFKCVWMPHLRSENAWMAFGVGHLLAGMLFGGVAAIFFYPAPVPVLIGYAIVTAFLLFFIRKYLRRNATPL